MDLMQREGNYPMPPGSPEIMGVEFSGTVVQAGEGATEWNEGDEVFGLARGVRTLQVHDTQTHIPDVHTQYPIYSGCIRGIHRSPTSQPDQEAPTPLLGRGRRGHGELHYRYTLSRSFDFIGAIELSAFTAGYPGTESAIRAALAEVLGEAKSDFFFDKVCRPS